MSERAGPVVYKFGGTSVGSAERIRRVAELVDRETEPLLIVVSAMSGVTDTLVEICRAAAADRAGEIGPLVERLRAHHFDTLDQLGLAAEDDATLRQEIGVLLDTLEPIASGDYDIPRPVRDDSVLSTGEDLSARLVAAALRARGRDGRWLDARRVVRTGDRHGKAAPDFEATKKACAHHLLPLLAEGATVVVGGFIGATADGLTTTLGRGGGDYSAALLAGATEARMLHIWTDVPGILSGDPRIVAHPRLLDEIGSDEVVELAYFGAKVIHPGAAAEAVARRVPMRIRSTFDPDEEGTLVRSDMSRPSAIAAVAAKSGVVLLKVQAHPWSLPYGFLAKVFDVLARHRTPVDLVATSHTATAFTIDETEELDEVVDELTEFADVEVVHDLSTVTVVGHGLMEEAGMDALVFWAVEKTPVHMISQASDVSLSFLVHENDLAPVLERLHRSLIELRAAARDGSDIDADDLPLPARATPP